MSRIRLPLLFLLLTLAAQQATAEPRPEATIPISDFDTLRATLEQRGWRVEKADNGDLLIYPAADDKAKKALSTAPSAAPEKAPAVEKAANLDELETIAERRGWQVERTEQGDLLLYPKLFLAPPAAPVAETDNKAEKRPPAADVEIPVEETGRLRKTLEARGWQTRYGDNGGLLLYPVSDDSRSVTLRAADLTTCLDGRSASVVVDDVTLPLDSKAAAMRIAHAWLATRKEKGVIVGRARRINDLFLVGIVAADKPHRLKRQLVIRAATGDIIAIP